MQWTCQVEGRGPLWWRIGNSDHWYRSDTPPENLAEDYLDAHPHERGRVLLLTWWKHWGRVEFQVRIESDRLPADTRAAAEAVAV